MGFSDPCEKVQTEIDKKKEHEVIHQNVHVYLNECNDISIR